MNAVHKQRDIHRPLGTLQRAAAGFSLRRAGTAVQGQITRPVMAIAVPATPAITPIAGNILLREMK